MNLQIIRNDNILKSKAFWIIMLSFFFKPAYFSQIYYLDVLFDVMKLVSFIIAVALVMYNGKYPAVFICALAYFILVTSITFVKLGDVKTVVLQSVSVTGAILTLYLMSEYIRASTIKCVLIIFEILIYANCLSVLIAPHGLYRFMTITGWWTDACWFLGIRNGMTLTYIIAFYLEWINYLLDKKEKRRLIIFLVIASFTIYRINFLSSITIGAGSAGGLVTCWLCVLIFIFIPKKIPFLNFFNACILNLLLFILLVFFRIQRLFSFFIEKVLHKTVTLSGRVYLWEKTNRVIGKSLVWGYGVEYGKDMAMKLKTSASVSTTQNGFLDIFYNGGIVLFCVFLVTIFTCAYILRNYAISSEYNTFIGYITFIIFLCCQSESMIGVRFFFYLQLIIITSAYIKEVQVNEVG